MKTFKDLGFTLDNKACKGKDYLDSDIKQDTSKQDDYILINLEGETIEILENEETQGYCDFCVLINLFHHADCFKIMNFIVSKEFYYYLKILKEKYQESEEVNDTAVSMLQHHADENIQISLEYQENMTEYMRDILEEELDEALPNIYSKYLQYVADCYDETEKDAHDFMHFADGELTKSESLDKYDEYLHPDDIQEYFLEYYKKQEETDESGAIKS